MVISIQIQQWRTGTDGLLPALNAVPPRSSRRTLVAHLADAVIVVVTALVRRQAVRVEVRARHARATVELAHLRGRAGTALEVGVATDGGERTRASGEVVVRDGVVRGGTVVAVAVTVTTIRSEDVVAVAGLEGAVRRNRDATVPRKAIVVVVGRLPVDGGHAIVKVLGRAELPLAEERPCDEDETNRASNGDKHD